jgi:hypothetical protein
MGQILHSMFYFEERSLKKVFCGPGRCDSSAISHHLTIIEYTVALKTFHPDQGNKSKQEKF